MQMLMDGTLVIVDSKILNGACYSFDQLPELFSHNKMRNQNDKRFPLKSERNNEQMNETKKERN